MPPSISMTPAPQTVKTYRLYFKGGGKLDMCGVDCTLSGGKAEVYVSRSNSVIVPDVDRVEEVKE